MDLDELDASPAFKIKKKPKANRASSLRNIDSPGPSRSATPVHEQPDEEVETGNVVFKRQNSKKSVGRTATNDKGKSKLSFGVPPRTDENDTASPRPSRIFLRNTSDLADSPAPERTVYSKEHLSQLAASTQSTPSKFDELTMSKYSQAALANEQPEEIPTTNAIAAAKMKRELARKVGHTAGEDDGFISLDVGFSSKGGESRFVREEDEGEGDQFTQDFTGENEIVALGKKARQKSAKDRKAGIGELIDEAEEEDERDDEAMEWENAQIRRAGNRVVLMETSNQARQYKPAPTLPTVPATTSLPTLSAVQSRLKASLQSLQDTQQANEKILEQGQREVSDLDTQEAELRSEIERVSTKFEWFVAFANWIEDVAAFLDAKFPLLESIERDNLSIQRERLSIITRRRYEDDADDLSLFTGASVSADLVPVAPDQNTDPALREYENAVKNDPNSAIRSARRSDRSMRLGAERNARQVEDGYTTEDVLSPFDAMDLNTAVTTMQSNLDKLFDDVQVDIWREAELGVGPRFLEWLSKYRDEYEKSYAGLSMIGVWEFWARVELSIWNPFAIMQLPPSPTDLEHFKWHAALSNYSHESGQTEAEDNVVGAMVADVVVPRLQELAKAAYDPYSTSSTTKALNLVEEVTYCVDKNGRKFESLVQAFLGRILSAVQLSEQLVIPHLSAIASPSVALTPDSIASRQRFALRQIKLMVQAVRWRKFAKQITIQSAISRAVTLDELLAQRLVGGVLLPILEAGWQTGGKELATRTLNAFPQGFFWPMQIRSRLEAP